MQLDVKERLTLQGLLPPEGSFLTLRIVRELKEALSFTETELKELNFKQDGNQLSWSPEKDPLKDVKIGKQAKQIVADTLEKLDKDEKLTEEHFTLYLKFIEAK